MNTIKSKGIVIAIISLLAIILTGCIFNNKKSADNNYVSSDYISLKMPLSLEEKDILESKIYTFIYDSNRTIKRIIFTDNYISYNLAQSEYKKIENSNNRDNEWNMPKSILKNSDKTITYEYESDIASKYYEDFIGESIDTIIAEYGEDRVLKDFKPNVSEKDLKLKKSETTSSTKKTNSNTFTKSDKKMMIEQVEKKFNEGFTYNYNTAYNTNGSYIVSVDANSINYTNEYSQNDSYYVMTVTVKGASTNIVIGKYLARCKWDSNSKIITDYGDNSRLIIITNVYEEALSKSSSGIGTLFIAKDQYKKDALWKTDALDSNNFKTVLADVDEINYYYYEYAKQQDETQFESMKKTQTKYLRTIVESKKINIHIAQLITDNELAIATELTDFINDDLYIAKDENWNKLIEYSKNHGLYYSETLIK